MKHFGRKWIAGILFCAVTASVALAQADPGVLNADEVKKVVPSAYYFDGQAAPVQLRNSTGFRVEKKLVLAGLVDNSGYSSDVQAKYQGFLITEVKLAIGGNELVPGQYGFGFLKDGKFTVMDVGNHDLLSADSQTDEKLARPVPLKIVADGDGYRLYAGRKWIGLKAK